jgi:hypothetical protein
MQNGQPMLSWSAIAFCQVFGEGIASMPAGIA